MSGVDLFVTAGGFEGGSLGGVFAKWGKTGSAAAGLMDAFSVVMSLAVRGMAAVRRASAHLHLPPLRLRTPCSGQVSIPDSR
jgi:hypothetical protein